MRRWTLLAIGLAAIPRPALAQEPPPAAPAETGGPAAPAAAAAPPVVSALPAIVPPPPAVAPPPPPVAPRPEWRPRDARFSIGVEHLFAFETLALQSTRDVAPDGSTGDFTTLRTTFPFSSDRFALPRLAFDVLFGGTVGAYVGYSRDAQSMVINDPILGRTESPERGTVSGIAGARGGAILGRGATVALWLRGGAGYWWSNDFPSDQSGFSSSAIFLALDPVVIIAPLPRLALTFGPYVEAASGSRRHRTKGVTDPGELTWIDLALRFTTNFSVMF